MTLMIAFDLMWLMQYRIIYLFQLNTSNTNVLIGKKKLQFRASIESECLAWMDAIRRLQEQVMKKPFYG